MLILPLVADCHHSSDSLEGSQLPPQYELDGYAVTGKEIHLEPADGDEDDWPSLAVASVEHDRIEVAHEQLCRQGESSERLGERERRTREQERRSCAVARTSSRSAGCSGISVKMPSISSALRHCALDAKSLAALATSPRRATRKRAASSSPIGVGASSFRSCTMSAVARAAAAGAGAAGAGAADAEVAPRVSNCGGGRGRGGALCSAGSPGCANEHVKPSVQQRAASHSWLQSSRHCQLQKPAATTPNNKTGDSTTPASCALARRTPAAAICAQAGTGPSEAPTGSWRVKWHGTMRELGFPTESELNYQMVRL